MKKRLSLSESLAVVSLLFGLFFGSGNLIFPVSLGQMAGSATPTAVAGFLVTAVGMPLLAVAALGITRSHDVLELSSRVGRAFGLVYTCALYLALGPLFVAPRCITVPFEVGVAPLLPAGADGRVALLAFSSAMSLALLWFSLRPGKILTWVGRILNPMLLVLLACLTIKSLCAPMGEIAQIAPQPEYASGTFLRGILDGYNTMDAAAGLAFGIIVISVLQALGVTEPAQIARHTLGIGFFSCAMMAVIYIALAAMGAQSRALYPLAENGGAALAVISRHYFTGFGSLFLALTVLLACLKTAIGLIVSCAQSFDEMFPYAMSYRKWTVLFCAVTFALANVGLSSIIKWSLPVLLTLYPLSIVLIVLPLARGGKFFSRRTMATIITFTFAGALLDTLGMMPDLADALNVGAAVRAAQNVIPLAKSGLAWVPAALAGGAVSAIAALRERK